MNDKDLVEINCTICGASLKIKYGSYRKNKNRCCSACNLEKRKQYWNNLSDEEKSKKLELFKNQFKKLNSKEQEEKIQKLSTGNKKYWDRLSVIEKNKMSIERSKRMKMYWNNIDTNSRSIRNRENYYNWYNGLSDKEKIKRITHLNEILKEFQSDPNFRKILSESRKKYFSNLSIKDKIILSKINRERSQKWWDSITEEDFQEWKRKRDEGYIKYLDNLGSCPNRNESVFLNSINTIRLTHHLLEYRYQWYNEKSHEEFNIRFPQTDNKFSSPYHLWDFYISCSDGTSIIVDIDGSIHNLLPGEFTTKDGTDVGISVQFNDSKRPYQTDGLDAYIVLAYDDNITNSTPVKVLNSGEIIRYKDFLSIIEYHNMSKKEIKEIMKNK